MTVILLDPSCREVMQVGGISGANGDFSASHFQVFQPLWIKRSNAGIRGDSDVTHTLTSHLRRSAYP